MNRRTFLKLTGAVGVVAATATVPRFAKQLAETAPGNIEFKGVAKGSRIWIGTKNGIALWTGEAVESRIYGHVPTKFNGDEVIIRIRKAGYLPIEIEGHKIPTDGTQWKLSCWQQLDRAYRA